MYYGDMSFNLDEMPYDKTVCDVKFHLHRTGTDGSGSVPSRRLPIIRN